MKKYYLLTPGPTPVPPRVAARSAEPIIHHRTKEFREVFASVQSGMKYVFRTKSDALMIMGSGTAAMDAAVVNTLSPGDHVIVGSIGSFGERWVKICQAYGVVVNCIREEWGRSLDPARIEQALKEDPSVKAVLVQHTDTSTGTANDLKTLGKIVAGTSAILIVDSVSGLGGEELHMDDWQLDVVVAGSQKCLMCPPGIAVAAVSEKAWKANETAKIGRFYSDFQTIRKSSRENETPWTPAVSLFQSLNEALKMIREETIEGAWEHHRRLMRMAHAGIKALGLPLLSSSPCAVLTAARLPEGVDGTVLIRKMLSDYGVSIAGGQDHLKGRIIRLAHMGYMDSFDMLAGLTAVEKTLKGMGCNIAAPGNAVAAAQSALP